MFRKNGNQRIEIFIPRKFVSDYDWSIIIQLFYTNLQCKERVKIIDFEVILKITIYYFEIIKQKLHDFLNKLMK